jgi:WD40 repeat protein/DNA-binding SARP family transcriptional activator
MPLLLDIKTLGEVSVRLDGTNLDAFKTRKELALLIYLAHTAQEHARDSLADLLWAFSSNPLANLRTHLSYLRRHAGDHVTITRQTAKFDTDAPYRFDVTEFETQLSAVRATLPPGKPLSPPQAAQLSRALNLYRGEFMAGFHVRDAIAFEEWLMLERESLHQQAVEAYHLLVDFYVRRRRYMAGIDVATRLLALAPLDEMAHRHFMELLARTGRRSAALTQYEQLRELLQTELGVEPGDETKALHRKILADAFDLLTPIPEHIHNPYKGLEPFTEEDAPLFFGREALVAQMLEHLGNPGALPWPRRFLAVVGPSGSGKSSLVRAGLLPALRRSGLGGRAARAWQQIVVMVPGMEPIAALSAALSGPLNLAEDTLLARLQSDTGALAALIARRLPAQGGLLLVIDQFEELYTLASEADHSDVVDILAGALQAPGGQLGIILTLRADYYAQPLYNAELGSTFHERAQVVVPMSAEELHRTIVGPAERVGLSVEPALVAALVADAGQTQSALPLLQYALTTLFEEREGPTLTLRAYRALGGLAGALAGRAEAIYSGLNPAQQLAARQIFLHLVMPGDAMAEGPDTGRRVALADLRALVADSSISDTVIQLFSRHRFLRLDRDPASQTPIVELAHEALIDAWKRLRDWVAEARELLYLHRRLESLAETWEQAGRDASYLLRGQQLAQFQDLSGTFPQSLLPSRDGAGDFGDGGDVVININLVAPTRLALSSTESAYLKASIHERQSFRQREAARRDREIELERRNRKRRRILIWVLAVVTFIALGLAGFAFTQRRRAERQAAVAQSLNLSSRAQIALSDFDTDLALILALEANKIEDPPPQARLRLAEAAYTPGTRRRFTVHTAPIEGLAMFPDGRRALSASSDHVLILWDLESGEMLRRFEGHTGVVHDVVLLAGGEKALSASADGTLILWEVATGGIVRTFAGHRADVWSIDVTPGCDDSLGGGCLALSGCEDGTLILWDIEDGEIVHRLKGHTDAVYSAAIGPEGQRALSGSADRSVILWDLGSGEILQTMAGVDDTVAGSQVAIGHFDGVWDVAFRPDGKTALSVSQDEFVILWDLETGELITRFDANAGLFSAALSRDARRALLGTLDNRLLLLDLETGQFIQQLRGHTGRVLAVAFTPDESGALSGAATGSLRLWDLAHGGELRRLVYSDPPDPAACDVAISPDGRLGLTGLWTGEISLWDYASGEEIRRLRGHTQMVFGGVHFLPDGRRAVSGAGDIFADATDNTLRVWDVETGAELQRMMGHTDKIWDTDVSPEGRWVASGSHDGTLRLWNLASGDGEVLLDVTPQGVRSVAFSPDGRSLVVGLAKGASSTPDYGLRILETETGQEVRRMDGHKEAVSDVAFSPDGRLILSGGHDQTSIVWDAVSGEERYRLVGHAAGILSVAFSPGGHLALTGATDGSLVLWDVDSGRALRSYKNISKPVTGLAFTPGGETFVVASDDDAVHEYRVDRSQAELMAWIEANRFVPELTCEQRERYQIDLACERR